MGLRTVRLDEDSEKALAEIRARTGASASAVLKEGLLAARAALRQRDSASPYAVFQTLDLGPGGYASFPARRAKEGIRALLRRKVRR